MAHAVAASSILRIIWIFAIGSNACAAFRLFYLSLYRCYRIFFAYLVFQLSKSIIVAWSGTASRVYFWTYVAAAPVLWVFYILIVRELYSLIFKNYQGIYTIGRWMMYCAGGLSVLISAIFTYASWRPAASVRSKLYYIEVTERYVVFSLVLFILWLLYFLSRYPVRLRRNLAIHSAVFSLLFLTDAVVALVYSLEPGDATIFANIGLEVVSGSCYLGWAFLMNRRGEFENVQVAHAGSRESEDRLLEQLNAINATLLHAIHK